MSSAKKISRKERHAANIAPSTPVKPQEKSTFSITEKYYPWLVAAFAALLYMGTLWHGYVYDDEIVIEKNVFVQAGMAGVGDIWTHNYVTEGGFNDGLYRPLSPTMFAFEVGLTKGKPWIGHFMNILMYALVCVMVFLFVKALAGGNDMLALIAGLLFAAHPIHTEVVANIKSRDEIMAALFGFAALYFTVKSEKLDFRNTLIIALLFLLSLFSKESAIAFAVVIPLVYWFKTHQINGPLFRLMAVLFAVALPWYLLHEYIIDSMARDVDEGLFSDLSNAVLMMDSKIDQMATGLWITVHYLYKSVIPYPLINDYSPNAIVGIPMASATGLFSLLVLGATFLVGCYLFYTRRNMAGLGILMFFLLLAPVANVFKPIGTTMGERLAFAPSLGIILVIVALYNYWGSMQKKYFIGGLLALFCVVTVARANQWKSNLKLYEADVKTQPNSFRTHYNYATALNKSVEERTGDKLTPLDRENLELSIEHFEAALKIRPDYADAILNLGNAYRRLGNAEKAKELYASLIKLKPDYTKAVYNLAVTYYEAKDYEPAHRFFIQYINSGGPLKGAAWYSAGVCSGFLGQFADAINELNNSLAIDNTKWDAWNYLGMAYGNTQQWEKAVGAFQNAYNLNPSEELKGNFEQAKRAFEETSAK